MPKQDRAIVNIVNQHGRSGFVAIVTWVGAFVYFLQGANSFNAWIGAFIEAFVWPGILLFHLLKFVGA